MNDEVVSRALADAAAVACWIVKLEHARVEALVELKRLREGEGDRHEQQ